MWFVRNDPWGILCVSLVYALTLGVAAAVNLFALQPHLLGLVAWCDAAAYNCLITGMLACHALCMLTNPGTARHHLDQDLQEAMRSEFLRLTAEGRSTSEAAGTVEVLGAKPRKWWCSDCDTFRPRYTHHCRTCGACILEMDHHCPWVNNCVGWRNHKYFLLFVAYAWILCVWSAWKLGSTLWNQSEATLVLEADWDLGLLPNRRKVVRLSWEAQLWCLLCIIISVFLALFASVMCCDQWEYLAQGHGVVDKKLIAKSGMHVAGRNATLSRRQTVDQRLAEVLGGGQQLSWRWFLPVAAGSMHLATVPQEELPPVCHGSEEQSKPASS